MTSRAEALARGAAQGATGNFGDEALGKILSALPMPEDHTGIPRTYAAGDEAADVTQTARNKDEAARQAYPLNFGAGHFAASLPSAIAAGAIPGGQAVLGAAAGAGAGTDAASRGKGAALGGLVSGASELGGHLAAPAISRAMGALKAAMPGAEPALAGINKSQLPLDLPEPQYWHHNTPTENLPAIAEGGLSPSAGGKNFPFRKNAEKIYLTDEGSSPAWGEKLRDATGKDVSELRTTKPVQGVPGAHESIKVRTEAIPPERLEVRASEGWKPLKAQGPASTTEKAPIPMPRPEPTQLPLNFERGNALRPGRAPSGEWDMPAIPKAGRTISEGEKLHLEDMADQKDQIDSGFNDELVKRSMAKSKGAPTSDVKTLRPGKRPRVALPP